MHGKMMQLKMLLKLGYHRDKTYTSKKSNEKKVWGRKSKEKRKIISSNRIFAEKLLKHEEKSHR
jgi:hypothetical protein